MKSREFNSRQTTAERERALGLDLRDKEGVPVLCDRCGSRRLIGRAVRRWRCDRCGRWGETDTADGGAT